MTLHSDDGSIERAPTLIKFIELLNEAMVKIGRPTLTAADLKNNLENAGFVDVKTRIEKQPIGPWPKDPTVKHIGAMVYMPPSKDYASVYV